MGLLEVGAGTLITLCCSPGPEIQLGIAPIQRVSKNLPGPELTCKTPHKVLLYIILVGKRSLHAGHKHLHRPQTRGHHSHQ